jgi:predicted ATP-grasp superfamily ATP-dependent carboligase
MVGTSNGQPAVLIPSSTQDTPGYPCLRSLGRRGVRTIYGTKYGESTISSSRYCDETVELPVPDEDVAAYKDSLLRVASRPDVRTIVPTNEYDAFVLSKFKSEFEPSVSLPVPSFEALGVVHDRMRLFEAADSAGVPMPETVPFDEVTDWDRELIVKSRYNLVTNDYDASCPPNEGHRVKDVAHLRVGETPDYDQTVEEMKHVPIVQEYVPCENEYMVGALCRDGEPVATVQLDQIREDSYKGGGGVYRKSTYDPEMDRVARDLLAELNWTGLACLEYMEDDETGEFKLAEINPRMWQSMAPAVRAGQDFPFYYWLMASGEADRIDPAYELGVGSHLLAGEAQHLKSILEEDSPRVEKPNFYAAVGAVALSCLLEPHFDIFRFDDPAPFVFAALSGARNRLESL